MEGSSEQVLTMCTQCKGSEITHTHTHTHTEPLPLPHACWTKHSTGQHNLQGHVCVCHLVYLHCVYVDLMSGDA